MDTREPSSNLHPIEFTKSYEPSNHNHSDDMSELFQITEEKGSKMEKKRSASCSSSWYGESELIVYKLFYFFFYAATALFAYLPLYYKKSLLLDHRHVGILMGIRPFCGFLGAPILGSFADKFNKYKTTLYTGLLTYIIVYLSVTFVNGVPKDCHVHTKQNHTNITQDYQGKAGSTKRTTKTYMHENLAEHLVNIIVRQNGARRNNRQSRKLPLRESSKLGKRENIGKPLYFSENVEELPNKRMRVVFKKELVDSNQAEKDPTENENLRFRAIPVDNLTEEINAEYDKYWVYGPETAGEDTWPIDVYRKEPPQSSTIEETRIRNHIFLILLLLMMTAELIGSPILSLADTATLQGLKKEPFRYGRQVVWAAVGFGFMSIVAGSVLHYTVSMRDEINNCPERMGEGYRPVFYSCCALLLIAFFTTFKFNFRTYEGKENIGCTFFYCIKYFRNVEYLLFAVLAFFAGLAEGLADSFLFVHLIRHGATPLLLVVTTTFQSVSKVICFYISPTLILKYGNFQVIYAGMLTSAVMFLYYSFLVSPWMVVPIELLAGLSSSCVWAALVSYVGAPPKIGATLQGIIHSLYIGLGRGIGGLFGGMILLGYGFDVLFRSFSLVLVVVVVVVSLVRYRRDEEVEPIWTKLWDYSPVAPYDTFDDEQSS